jgi:hypothetical protein
METVPSIGAAEAGASSGGNEAVAPHLYRRDRASWRARLSPSWLPMIREPSDRPTTWSACATAAQQLDGETDSSLSPIVYLCKHILSEICVTSRGELSCGLLY